MGRVCFASMSAAVVGSLSSALLAQPPIRVGIEFQVNTYTPSNQYLQSIAADADGDFVVVWKSFQDPSDGVFARRFSSAGVAQGSDFQVNTYTPNNQAYPSVGVDSDGDFVVVWSSHLQDGAAYGVFARRFSSAGVGLAAEFQVNTYTPGFQSAPSVAVQGDGDFVVAWNKALAVIGTGNDDAVYARRFSSAGTALGAEFRVNLSTSSDQGEPSVAADSEGDFVVVWNSTEGIDGSDSGIFARRFSSAGVALGVEFQVNGYTPLDQRSPSAAADADGDFVVAWESYGRDGSRYGVFARRFSSAGVALGSEFQVSNYTLLDQRYPSAAAHSNGDFVVVWMSGYDDPFSDDGQDGSRWGVFARRFTSAGAALGAEFQVNTHTPNSQEYPTVAASGDGNFVVAWGSRGQDESEGVFAQRFASPGALPILDVTGNGGAPDALTDGLLILRFQFGFTGATLTTGAVGAGCTRCDAAAIQTYLGGLATTLDIDGNGGAPDALTDGLLTLRFLFGFTGATLTNGAVGSGCTRCNAATIQAHLTSLFS